MKCPNITELPEPPIHEAGWPWTEESPKVSEPAPGGTSWPQISIVLPSYNQGKYLERAIRSVLLQGYPSIEFIIIDGGSTDESVSIIKKYAPWIGHWTSARDNGVTDAVTKGLNRAVGQCFGIMCADDLYTKGAFSELTQLRLKEPGAVAWVGAFSEIDDDSKLVGTYKPYINNVKLIGDWFVEAAFSPLACIIDATSYRKVGGIDNRFLIANDLDLWIRLSKIGNFAFTNEVMALSHVDYSSVSHRDDFAKTMENMASNFINGNYDIAKSILSRFVNERIDRLQAYEVVRKFPVDEIVSNLSYKLLVKALLRRTIQKLRNLK